MAIHYGTRRVKNDRPLANPHSPDFVALVILCCLLFAFELFIQYNELIEVILKLKIDLNQLIMCI
jgi:hypothetical protein